MQGKRILSRLWWGGLVILAVLWAQIPVMAQEKVTDELAEVEAALAGQMFVVEQLKTNFDSLFGIASELEGEVTSLKGEVNSLEGEVTSLKENVESLTEKFLRVTAQNTEFQVQIDSLTEEFLRVTGEFQAQIDSLTVTNADLQAQIDSLKAINTEQATEIGKLKTQRLLFGLGFLVATYLYAAQQ